MEPYLIAIIFIVAAAIVTFVLFSNKKRGVSRSSSTNSDISANSSNSIVKTSSYEMKVSFEHLPALTEQEEAQLVEVKDNKLLARIDSAVPGTLQAVANTGAIKNYQEVAESVGQLYQAVIPKGAVLDKSRAMDGAFRGSYREVANSIKGNANWVPVDNEAANNLATMGAANAVMGVAAMVVGQYYMTQINDQLEDISAGIEKIADFQQNEFKSKVYALVAEIQKISTFQIETIENQELRNRELTHLKSLEHECAQLLGQANMSLQDISKKKGLDYEAYEKQIGDAEIWYQYQQILLDVMYKTSDLSYALNLGAISRENSNALALPYAKQTEDTLLKLNEWHSEYAERFQIEIEDNRRKRQGIGGFFMGVLGLVHDDFNYKKISQKTAARIEHQARGVSIIKLAEESDLYIEDVRLIAKDGKLYYLPETVNNEQSLTTIGEESVNDPQYELESISEEGE